MIMQRVFSAPLLAESVIKELQRLLSSPSGMWILAVGAGVLALFIITRGKWR